MGRAVDAVRALGGVATYRQLLELTSRRSLRSACARGELVKPSRGIYSLPRVTLGALHSRLLRGALSHQSAAAHWQLEQRSPATEVHVTVPRKARPASRPGVRVHYGEVGDETVTPPLRTVLDCARALPFADALAIADSACRLGLLTPAALRGAADELRGAGRARVRRVARHADGRAANAFESSLRAILIDAGITGFEPQLTIPGARPTIRVDLGDPRRRIALEADSFAHHGARRDLARDCRRYDELISRDWLVLRFAWEHVMFEPGWVRQMVRDTCLLRDAATGTGRSARGEAGSGG